uniref:Uncharacterized protein n=1 Tax=Capra hircus TaxID=9925 RepID=A0A8C2XYI4_CAPHI
MAPWEWIALSLHCWVLAVAAVSDQHATSPFDWLLSDKGPFHRSQEYTDFVDRSRRQGFSTRYKIYRYEAKGKQWQRFTSSFFTFKVIAHSEAGGNGHGIKRKCT